MWRLRPGSSMRVGEAEIKYEGEEVYLRDLYSERRFEVSADEVEVRPFPPVNIPSKVTDYLMLRFEEPIVPSDGQEVWLAAPYDLGVLVNGVTLGYVSPFVVKYALYGPTTEGLVCRFHRTPLMSEPPEPPEAGLLVRFTVRKPRSLDRIVMPVAEVDLFHADGRIFYERVEAKVEDEIYVELKNQPPVEAELVYPLSKTLQLMERIASGYRMVW